MRDKSRLSFLLKDKVDEQSFEEQSKVLYCQYLEEKGVRSSGKDYFGFPIMNIKIFKILFNQAYRLSGTDNDKAI